MSHLPDKPIVLNALCVGSGGNATLAKALPKEFSRLGRKTTLLLTTDKALHVEISHHFDGHDDVDVHWAPAETANRITRLSWERKTLPGWLRERDALAILQLNGMAVLGLRWPTLAHLGDPWPYLPVAYTALKHHFIAFGRRRAHRHSLRRAETTPYINASFTSNFLRDLIAQNHGPAARSMPVFYNGLPDHLIDTSSDQDVALDQREPMVLTVSNVSRYKRQEMIIKALRLIPNEIDGKPLRYHIIGWCNPAYKTSLEKLIRELKLEERVVLEGRVGDERLAEAYKTARVMAFLSVCESFGIPIVEAQSRGTPVVVSNEAALPEVAGDGAIIADADTPEAAAAAIRKAFEADASLIARGRENIKRFRWHDTAKGMVAEMDRLHAAFVQLNLSS
ncbi:MAG: glycosyltransferase [Planctomycetota bacterium]